jgi:hypothetical protein
MRQSFPDEGLVTENGLVSNPVRVMFAYGEDKCEANPERQFVEILYHVALFHRSQQ